MFFGIFLIGGCLSGSLGRVVMEKPVMVLSVKFSSGRKSLSDPGLCSQKGDASRDLVHVEDRQTTQPYREIFRKDRKPNV